MDRVCVSNVPVRCLRGGEGSACRPHSTESTTQRPQQFNPSVSAQHSPSLPPRPASSPTATLGASAVADATNVAADETQSDAFDTIACMNDCS